MTCLLETDHITSVQRDTGRAYATRRARRAQHPPEELAFPSIADQRGAAVEARPVRFSGR